MGIDAEQVDEDLKKIVQDFRASEGVAAPGEPARSLEVVKVEEPKKEASKPEPVPEDVVSPADAAALVVTIVDVLVPKALGEHMRLTPAERETLTAAALPVAKKYVPLISVSPEWILLGAVVAVYGPKALAGAPEPVAQAAESAA